MPSPAQKLKILKTKTWAWTCARNLAGSEVGEPKTAYALAQAANEFANRAKRAKTYDQAGWFRYLKGDQSANEYTVNNLWKFARLAYTVGPLTSTPIKSYDKTQIMFFVPLWNSISGDAEKIIKDWNNVGIPVLNRLTTYEDGTLIGDIEELQYKRKINDLYDLHTILSAIIENQINISSMIVFSALIARQRIFKSMRTYAFEPPTLFQWCDIEDFFETKIEKEFSSIGISESDISNVLYDYSLIIRKNRHDYSVGPPDYNIY